MGRNLKPDLSGKVCLVTGASRGIGKGIAIQLAKAGALVYITARTLESTEHSKGSLNQTTKEIETAGGKCRAVQCDHSNDEQVKQLFETIKGEQTGRLDVLVNNAYSGVDSILGKFGQPYWKQPISIWDEITTVGLRSYYVCTVLGTQMMVEQGGGLIVNISSFGGLKYFFNVPYGVGKAAVDRISTDCAQEASKYGVCVVSLWPGAVRTETMAEIFALSTESSSSSSSPSSPLVSTSSSSPPSKHGDDKDDVLKQNADNKATKAQKDKLKNLFKNLTLESPEFSGLGIAHLAADRTIMNKSGKILLTSDLASEYGFKDVDGSTPYNYRSVSTLLNYGGYKVSNWVPSFIKVPRWAIHLASNKF